MDLTTSIMPMYHKNNKYLLNEKKKKQFAG